jgi:hypothetical protein
MKTLMRKVISVFCCATLMLLLGCQLTNAVKDEVKLAAYEVKMNEVAGLWESKINQFDNLDRERDGTWFHFGLRFQYAVLKDYASLEQIQAAAKLDVFKSGPHSKGLSYSSKNDFGHYNPAFVKQTFQTLKRLSAVPGFKKLGQQIYDAQLSGMAKSYYKAHQFINSSPQIPAYPRNSSEAATSLEEVIQTYKNKMQIEEEDAGDYIQEVFRPYADRAEKADLDWYLSNVAAGFWVRRKIDGTDKDFFALLEYVIATYDAEFK